MVSSSWLLCLSSPSSTIFVRLVINYKFTFIGDLFSLNKLIHLVFWTVRFSKQLFQLYLSLTFVWRKPDWEVLMGLALKRLKLEVSTAGGKVSDSLVLATHLVVLSVPGFELDFETVLNRYVCVLCWSWIFGFCIWGWLLNNLQSRSVSLSDSFRFHQFWRRSSFLFTYFCCNYFHRGPIMTLHIIVYGMVLATNI